MTATEQLRKLLDERGIGWYSRTRELQQWNQEQIDFHTAWSVNGARFEAEEDATEKKLHVRSYAYLLPEQAIAATLGTPISADLRTALDFMRIWITDDAHLGESAISYEFEKAEGLRKLDAIEQAIAATLGSDDDYESKMDALLCRLTNGKWSKSRAYDLDFMVSCIDEKYEEDYADELAVTTQGTTEIVRCRDCKHYHKHKWFDIIPGTPLGSDMSDVCMFFGGGVKVEPGGFCKWGERREQ